MKIQRRYATGFTLIELMVVAAIIAILIAIAIPAYGIYITKSSRTAAKGVMLDLAQMEERYYSNQIPPVYLAIGATAPSPSWPNYSGGNDAATAKYAIRVTLDPPTMTNPTTAGSGQSFLITATPTNGFVDSLCGNLLLYSNGTKTTSTGASNCW